MERLRHFHFNRHRFSPSGKIFGALYTANFFLALHLFLVAYINSNYLATLVPEVYVGILYLGGALLSFLLLLWYSRLLDRFGNFRLIITLVFLEFLVFIGLAFPGHIVIALLLFMLYFALYPLLILGLDIFIEHYTNAENATGGIRGTYLTAATIALIIAPLFAGFIVGDNDFYARVFLVSAFFLIPFLFIVSRNFHDFKDSAYTPLKLRFLTSCVFGDPSIGKIFKAHFIMQLFFAWMVIYIPLYLHEHIGFEWTTLGIMFTIMLLPYLFIELPAGKIADRWLGEKELLSIGFIITAASVGAMSFITTPNVFLWGSLLFVTRIGAALLESMTETYFFKHVDSNDTNTISGFRMLRPISYITGTLLGAGALLVIDLRFLFLIFAVVILWGLRYSLTLRDTL